MTRVHLCRCPDYDPRRVDAAVEQSLRALPGFEALFKPGQRVLLKPNLLQAKPSEAAVTTHPSIVAAVARMVRAAGATPVIADSPGGAFNPATLRRLYHATGMAAAAEESGALLSFDCGTVRVAIPGGRATQTLDAMRVAVEADAIINLPKLKTHGLTHLSGAIKNLFGTVPGITKARYHALFPTVDRFSAMLIDILAYYKPVLTVMDAIVGMEGDGPSAGNPRQIGVLLAGPDAVAVDVIATALIGIVPASVPTIAAAVRRKLSTGRVEDIELSGASVEAVRVAGFRPHRSGMQHVRMLPSAIPRWITDRLLADPQAGGCCTACGVCVVNCPVQAITITAGRACTDARRCIHCFCCHELCPEDAVELHRPILARLLDR